MRLSRGAPALTLILAAFVACAAPAVARPPAPSERNSPEAVRALHDFARCVARNHWSRGRARDILAMDYRTDAYRDAVRALAGEHGDCVAPFHRLSFNILLFVGGLAEALLPQDRDLAALVAYDPARPPYHARDEIEVMSLCTVRAQPAAAASLFATIPASREEAAALRGLAPQLGQCLRAHARTRVNPLEIRAFLALAAWHLSEHNQAPVAASAEAPPPGRPTGH